MKLKFDVDSLLPRIGQCVSVVNTKNSLPILNDLLFETKDDGNGGVCLLMTASDSETWLSVKGSLMEADKDIRICVNATDIYKALSNLKGKQIEMAIDESAHTITCKHANGRFSLPFEEASEYPQPAAIESNDETATTKMLVGSHVLRSLEKAGFATANDELRPVMNGVHFDFLPDGMVSVATDGHKLAKFKDKEVTFEKVGGDESPIKGFTLPKKPSTTLMNILSGYDGNIKLVFNDRAVIVNNTDFKMTTRLIEGRYPNYDGVIPKDNDVIVTVPKADFVSALKRVLPMSNTSSELVSVKMSMGMITLEAVDFDFSKSASENIECDYFGAEIAIGFKGSVMLAVAQNIDGDHIKIALKDPSRAGLFVPANEGETTEYTSLLMPMLIQGD